MSFYLLILELSALQAVTPPPSPSLSLASVLTNTEIPFYHTLTLPSPDNGLRIPKNIHILI